jgi:hypothetical protein
MLRLKMLIVMTAMVLVAAGSAKGNTSWRPLRLDSAAATASGQSSFTLMRGGKNLSRTILLPPESTAAQLLVTVTAEDGKDDGDKNPPSRSTHCPPDKGDNHNLNYRDDNQTTAPKQDNGNTDTKDKDHHDDCGKGDDGKNP